MSVTTRKEMEPYVFSACAFDWRDSRCEKALADAGELTFISEVREDLAAQEKSSRQIKLQGEESVAVAAGTYKALQRQVLAGIFVAFGKFHQAEFQRAFEETFKIQANRAMELALEKPENLVVTMVPKKDIKAVSQEALSLAEEFSRRATFYRAVLTEIGVTVGLQKKMEENCREAVAIRMHKVKETRKLRREKGSFAEAFRRNLILRRDFKAKLGLGEKIVKKYALQKREAVTLYDAFVRACNAVLSNIGVSAGEMSFEDFMQAVDRPPNYDKFCDFNVGEYEYQKALVRFIMISKAAQTEPVLYDLTVHVDIDDTNDRGIAEITDTTAPTKVRFNKFYYHPPEVNVTLKGGNTADGWIVPYLIRTDGEDEYGRYFEVELRSSGQRVAGTVSWTSKGY